MFFVFVFAQVLSGLTVNTPMSFIPGPVAQAASTFTASPNSVVADGSSAVTLTFSARDIYNNAVSGTAVTLAGSGGNNTFSLASGVTDANGIFQATLNSRLSQTETVTASFGNTNSLNANVTFVPGIASATTSTLVLSPNSQIANNSNSILAQLTLSDAQGNPISAVTPTFSASGTSTSNSSPNPTTATGKASVTYQTALAQNENAVVSAGGITFTMPMTFVAGPPTSAASSLIANPNVAASTGNAFITLTATARDAQGNPVPGVAASLSASGGNNTFTAATGTTASNGTYATTLASTQMQTETITVQLGANVTVPTQVTFTGPASAMTSFMTINPNTVVVGPSNFITATITLKDANSAPLSAVTPTWTASGTNVTVGPSGNTNSSGVATATYTSTVAQNQNAMVSAGGLSFSIPTTFSAGSPNFTASSFYALPARQLANNTNTITTTLVLQDVYQNPISGSTVTFSASGTSTTVSGAVTTNGAGLAQGTYTASVAQNENAVATVSGLTFTKPIVFTGRPTQCTLTANPNVQSANGNAIIPLVAVFKDANNTAVPGLLAIFSTTGNASTFSPIQTTTDSQGRALSSLTSTYASQNLVIAQAANVQCTTPASFTTKTGFCPANPNFISTGYAVQNGPRGVAVGDLNKDGLVDIVVTNESSNNMSFLLGAGGGGFTISQSLATGSQPSVPAIADLNGDGYMDIVVPNIASNTISVFLATGLNTYTAQTTYPIGSSAYNAMLIDMNLDGVLDVVTCNGGSSTVSVLLGTGVGTFSAQSAYATDSGPNFAAFGDFNRDGKSDIVTANYSASTISVLTGTGTGGLRTATSYAADGGPTGVSVGDFNGDGYQDIVITARNSATINIFLGQASGGFASKVAYATTGNPQYPLVTDINGDGIQDIIATSESNSNVAVHLGKGDGSFVAFTTIALPYTTKHAAAADFDGDGKKDIVVNSQNNATATVMLNAGCQ